MKIKIINHEGKEYNLEVQPGDNLMAVAVEQGVKEIIADCGGGCACATCHCFIDNDWKDLVGEISPIENEMLDFTETDRKQTSRLACQITLTEELEGMEVHLPEEQ